MMEQDCNDCCWYNLFLLHYFILCNSLSVLFIVGVHNHFEPMGALGIMTQDDKRPPQEVEPTTKLLQQEVEANHKNVRE